MKVENEIIELNLLQNGKFIISIENYWEDFERGKFK